tara:strand:+ start:1205 stop:1336 length:132 start_codon:yes stop_codon:yes gene_type:complete
MGEYVDYSKNSIIENFSIMIVNILVIKDLFFSIEIIFVSIFII